MQAVSPASGPALVGRRPSLEEGRAKSAPNPLSAIPAGLFEVIVRGLSAERDERPASVREFLRDLTDTARQRQPDAMRAAIMGDFACRIASS